MTKENELKKRYLMRYIQAMNDELKLAEEIDSAYALAYPSGISYDGVGSGAPVPHGLETVMARVDSLVGDLRSALAHRQELRRQIAAVIESLDCDGVKPEVLALERDVLTRYYMLPTPYRYRGRVTRYRQKSIQEVADEVGYSRDRIAHVHGDALAHLSIQ